MQITFVVVALIVTLSMAAPATISPNYTVARSPIKGGSSNTGSGNFIRETLAEVKARNPETDATLTSEGFFQRAPIKGGSSNIGSGNFVREAIKGGTSNTGSGNFRREAVKGGSSNTGSGNF